MKKQRLRRELDRIVPFNRYLFKSCYYHQLIAAFAHYGVEESYVIENFVDLYDFDEKNDLPVNKALQVYDDDEFAFISGIKLIKRKDSRNFIREIGNAIDRDVPVIVAVDCFWLAYRQDVYQKRHITHFMLVYGYDWSKRQFLVNEHYYLNSYVYSPHWVEFDVLERAWNAYKTGLADRSGYSLVKVEKFKEKVAMPDGYLSFLRDHRDDVRKSLACVDRTKNLFFKAFLDESMLREKLENLFFFIGTIRPKKEMQKNYFHARDARLQEIADRILNDYIFVHGILVKFKFTGLLNEVSIEKCKKRISEIAELEKTLHAYYLGEWECIIP